MVVVELGLLWMGVSLPTAQQTDIGLAILIAWCALRWSGQWSREAGWIDRLGRLVGLSWIGTGLFTLWAWRK
jgi:hypothetical protein